MTKSGKPRHVPMSHAVIELLNGIVKTPDTQYPFANPKTGKSFNTIHNA